MGLGSKCPAQILILIYHLCDLGYTTLTSLSLFPQKQNENHEGMDHDGTYHRVVLSTLKITIVLPVTQAIWAWVLFLCLGFPDPKAF